MKYAHVFMPTRIMLFLILFLSPNWSVGEDRFEQAPIFYSQTQADNSISKLQESLDADSANLDYDDAFGYLPSLLENLRIARESQVLVFSKTSLQHRYISPETPRALYYNDEVYVGAVHRGDLLEISVADPNLGAVFYSLSQRKTESGRATAASNATHPL